MRICGEGDFVYSVDGYNSAVFIVLYGKLGFQNPEQYYNTMAASGGEGRVYA